MQLNKIKKLLFITIILSATTLLMTGCGSKLAEQENPEPQESKTSKRFQEESNKGTAVESAVILSKKYSKLQEEHKKLQEKYETKREEKQQLIEEKSNLQAELKQTEKELKEANDLLKTTVKELNNWKSNVLGFQQEVRKADQAQLSALYKILRLMGGQPNGISDPNQRN